MSERADGRQMFVARGGHVLTFPVEGGRTLNIVAMHTSEKWEAKSWLRKVSKEQMMADFDGHCGMVRGILGVCSSCSSLFGALGCGIERC